MLLLRVHRYTTAKLPISSFGILPSWVTDIKGSSRYIGTQPLIFTGTTTDLRSANTKYFANCPCMAYAGVIRFGYQWASTTCHFGMFCDGVRNLDSPVNDKGIGCISPADWAISPAGDVLIPVSVAGAGTGLPNGLCTTLPLSLPLTDMSTATTPGGCPFITLAPSLHALTIPFPGQQVH